MENFIETAEGVLLFTNGYDGIDRWDGQEPQAVPAGLAAPTTAITIAASGTGAIVGTYFAYSRFVDNLGNYSNLSPISDGFDAFSSGTTGNITNATFAAPIAITSAAHGLSTGAIVKVEDVGGNTSANGTWTITVVDANTFTLNGSSGNASYTGSGSWHSGVSTIVYNNVPTTTDPKVVRRQILRNTDGQATTFYVDGDTTDLTTTTFHSTRTDTELAAQESQAILDSNGLPLANLRGVPPTYISALASHLDRVFGCGLSDELRGSAIVTAGSTTVQGVGTDWVAGLAGRSFYVVGAANNYEILSVDVVNQTLTLTTPYSDGSDNFAVYAIRAAPAIRRLVFYTPAGQPESWPPTFALQVQEDSDELVCPMARSSFVYFLEKRHIYKFTFQDDPAIDGAIFLAANRGCINKRCWALIDGDAYMLDEYGIHKFDQNGQVTSLSSDIQELFRPGSLYKFQINWRAARHFFVVVSRPQETVRWFVALEGDYLPRHAICYNYRLQRWWMERYPFMVGSGVSGHINGSPVVFLCGENCKVYAMWTGTTDVASPGLGTIRGNVTSSELVTLTDSTANFCTSGIGSVINAPVTITDYAGKGQTRKVVSATATTLTVDIPWTTTLDATLGSASTYQVGGVTWNWKCTWMRLTPGAPNDTMSDRSFEVLFEPTIMPCTMDFRLRYNFGDPEIQKQSFTSEQGGGVRTDAGRPDKVIDLTRADSVITVRAPGYKEKFGDGRRYTQIELAGSTNEDLVAVFEIIMEGMGSVAIVSQQQ